MEAQRPDAAVQVTVGDPDRMLTLGDLKAALDDLIALGFHPGSIHWILRQKLDHDCGDCDLCDCIKRHTHPVV